MKGTSTIDTRGCTVNAERTFPLTIQGVATNAFTAKGVSFDFQDFDQKGSTLCLGLINLLETELTPFIRALTSNKNILIASTPQFFLASNPQVTTLSIVAIENPITFALDVARAFKKLNIVTRPVTSDRSNSTCRAIAHTISPLAFPNIINHICTPLIIRQKRLSKTLGRSSASLNNLEFSFTPIPNSKQTLCLSRLWLYQNEVNRVVSRIKRLNLTLGSVAVSLPFTHPKSYYVNFQSIENPFVFARKSAIIIQGIA
ncbi:DUF1259 domain-containing protein [Hazenella sp. IB182357]|uniref:DUF1259 domain-containing protein n=1 Tax=Polycladospora coralii TaxID=2771432 RepID=A0A926NAH1_9BACL|nr:DUF1259 domain-containing protein [Polycladospora coralii]MBD1372922.1 DUF1259 domain-containing protein [Polycladospora coralii]